MVELRLHSDGSERVPYRSESFPLHMSRCALSMYPGMCCTSHWHDDHEFIVVQTGCCVFRVNGLPVSLASGEGLYLAPRNMHSVEAVNGEDCEYLCAVFPTALLGASPKIAEALRAHLAAHEASRYLRLLPAAPGHQAVIRDLLRLQAVAAHTGPDAELLCLSTLYQLAADLGNAIPGETAIEKPDRGLAQLRDMIGYIRLHAAQPLTVSDIARAGRVSRSGCENTFARILHTSPMRYVTDSRLEMGMDLLLSTALSISEIAHACGFCSGSYFAEQFHRRMGCTPGAFRKKHRGQSGDPCRYTSFS